MSKKGKRSVPVKADPPPPSSSAYPMPRDDDRARFKYQSLMQDFDELIRETNARKERLLELKQRKQRLLAEVKFLRRKYRCFTENSSRETQYRLKKQLHKMPSPSYALTQPSPIQPLNPVVQSEPPPNGRNNKVKESGRSSTTPVLDLNQCSIPNGDDVQEFQVEWEPEKSKSVPIKGECLINDLNIPIYRDNGSTSSSLRLKRKISWQDQMAVKV